ncbi:hypothetical protein E2C01_011030 [Portunus trituberculatus]|uniref:Uncharacterized protein n=1 Tax=Portunus trituberculatus TaxID=210409 RepID=A0A5B7D9Y3_PORTR|nr:hypothetical protein [Portunus trituberculatus]
MLMSGKRVLLLPGRGDKTTLLEGLRVAMKAIYPDRRMHVSTSFVPVAMLSFLSIQQVEYYHHFAMREKLTPQYLSPPAVQEVRRSYHC